MLNLLIQLKSNLLGEALKFYLLNICNLSEEISIDLFPQSSRNYDIVIFDKPSLKSLPPNSFESSKKLLFDDDHLEEETLFLVLYYKLSGVIATNTPLDLFLKCLKVVLKDEIWLSNNLMKKLCTKYESFNKSCIGILTAQERKITELICEGLSNREIALRLSLSEKTVKAHLYRIFRKTGVKSRNQLIKLYLSVFPKPQEASTPKKLLKLRKA